MITEYMWDDGDGEIGCKDGDGLGNYRQGATIEARCRYRIIGMADKVSGKDSGG